MTTTPLVCFTSVLVGNIELCAKEPVALYKIVILPKFANRYISSSPDRKRYGLSRIGIPCTPAVDENGCKGLIECDCSRRRFLFSPLSGSFQIKDSREREKADGCLPIDRSSHTINPAGFHRYVIKADVVDIYVRAGVSVSYSAAGGHRAHRSVTTAAAAAAAAAVVADLPVTNDSPREIIKKKKRK